MTRKECELIARVFARAKSNVKDDMGLEVHNAMENSRQYIATCLAHALKEESASFRDDLFLKACNISKADQPKAA